jgi:hypothetical protein
MGVPEVAQLDAHRLPNPQTTVVDQAQTLSETLDPDSLENPGHFLSAENQGQSENPFHPELLEDSPVPTDLQAIPVKPAQSGAGPNQGGALQASLLPEVKEEGPNLCFAQTGRISLVKLGQLAHHPAVGFLSVKGQIFKLDVLKETLHTWEVIHTGGQSALN